MRERLIDVASALRSDRYVDAAAQRDGQNQAGATEHVGATSLQDEFRRRGARITRPLEERPWSCRDFYVEDPDGYILCFSEPTA